MSGNRGDISPTVAALTQHRPFRVSAFALLLTERGTIVESRSLGSAGSPLAVPMYRVQVLLSTYNGRGHLAELLDSVLAQRGVKVEVLVRDDGSTDATPELLSEYALRAPVRVVRGENVGVVSSFFWLLGHAARDVDAVALADQDDVWLPGKLLRALQMLERVPAQRPALYCSRQTLADANLRPLRVSTGARRGPSFGNALVENVVTGCTAVLNPPGLCVAAQEVPGVAHMHDWWLYQVISALGDVIYDDVPSVLYRQHGGNVVGSPATVAGRALARVRRVAAHGRFLPGPAQLLELRRIHGSSMPEHRRRLLDRVLGPSSWPAKLRLAASPELVCQARWKSVALRCLLALNLV